MFGQIPHDTGTKHIQFWCLILGLMTLHEMGSAQDILRFLTLVPTWVALPSLPVLGLLGKRQGTPGVVFCRANLELQTRNILLQRISVLINF